MIGEIKEGIKNAMERGASLEEASQSFFNAGYNPVEVRQAASELSSGVTHILTNRKEGIRISGAEFSKTPPNENQSQELSESNRENQDSQKEERKGSRKIIIIVLMILALISLLGLFIFLIVFKPNLSSLFNS